MSTAPDRRRELRTRYKETPPPAGVYKLVNTQTGRTFLAASMNLPSEQNKLRFAQSINSPGILNHRLKDDLREYGVGAFRYEVVQELESNPEMTRAEIRDELTTLEALWRESFDPALLY